jgi:hypothetical protein
MSLPLCFPCSLQHFCSTQRRPFMVTEPIREWKHESRCVNFPWNNPHTFLSTLAEN